MKNFLFIALLFFSANVFSQTINQPSVGASYMNQVYYTLNDGSTISNPHTDWDIAFDVSAMGAGILVNEGVGLSFTAALPEVELYHNSTTDFATADTTGISRIYNMEVEWTTGAFNSVAAPSNPLDYGWGSYNTSTHAIDGSRVFFIKLRNGVYKKIEIQSLISGVYTFRYADLDGSNEITQTIDKANYSGKTLAYFSIENGTAHDLEPAAWDLLFTRYSTPLDDGAGGIIDYTVTGVLHNAGVEVAQADNIDPTTVDHNNYINAYADTLDIIGSDWKSYDFQTGWVITANQVFFVKTVNDGIWKVQFFDFEGSSTGVTTLEKSQMTVSTTNFSGAVSSFDVFPNPVIDHVNIAFELETDSRKGTLELYNTLGQTIFSQSIAINNGFNVKRLPVDVASGTYYLTLRVDNEMITKPVFVK